MSWVWMGVGAAIVLVAFVVYFLILNHVNGKVAARKATIGQRQYDAETAMVRTMQNTIAEMFDAVRRQR